MLYKYYNKKTHTLTLPFDFNSLLKDLPLGIKIIIVEGYYIWHNTLQLLLF